MSKKWAFKITRRRDRVDQPPDPGG
jgi:hypothetical protein